MGTGVELAAKRYGADPRYQARALPRSLPSSNPAPTRQASKCGHKGIFCESSEPGLPFARAHAVYMYQAYLDATPLLFPTLASLRRAFSRG